MAHSQYGLIKYERLLRFFFPKNAADSWLALLRVGLGLQVGFYCWSLRWDWRLLFTETNQGLVGRDLTEALLNIDSSFIPRVGWLVSLGRAIGLTEPFVLELLWWTLLFGAVFLLAGLYSRPVAILTWFLHLCAAKSSRLLAYGMDHFTTIGLFYLMLAPLPDRWSLDFRWRGLRLNEPELHGFFRRVLQLHLCAIYFFGGITKSLGAGWWNGASIWRALMCPPFNVAPPHVLVSLRYFFPILGIAVCILETGYAVFIWPRRTRGFWLLAIIGMHISIGLTMGLYLFSLIMIVLNVAAFGPGTPLFRFPALGKKAIPA